MTILTTFSLHWIELHAVVEFIGIIRDVSTQTFMITIAVEITLYQVKCVPDIASQRYNEFYSI